jgi:hypothetical protein
MATEVSLLAFHLLLSLRVSFYRVRHTNAATFIVTWALIGRSIGKILSFDEPFLFFVRLFAFRFQRDHVPRDHWFDQM